MLVVQGINTIQSNKGGPLQVADIFSDRIFLNIVLSLAATLGLYIVASLIFVSVFSLRFGFGWVDPNVVLRSLSHGT